MPTRLSQIRVVVGLPYISCKKVGGSMSKVDSTSSADGKGEPNE